MAMAMAVGQLLSSSLLNVMPRSSNLMSCYLLPVYGVRISNFSKDLLQSPTPTPILAFPTSLEYYYIVQARTQY